MSVVRQDAWSQEEDVVLAEVVLTHIQEGKTQLQAFEEVGKRLGRTSAACGFRWNASIRKQYAKAIQKAKANKTPLKHEKPLYTVESNERKVLSSQTVGSMEDVIRFLQQMQQTEHASGQLEREIERERSEKEALLTRLQNAEQKLARVEEDYQTFLALLDKARSLPGMSNK
ncbi:RsfA family transcriptional regulator [Geomicrobium sp. JSM 1781026]|uniref:RsfA family transcriptional regulator n=1 Tax=Geomicrobium sp. JSM 1781026 TaxID=3344580 RepID=UPI0035C1DA41